MNDDNDNRFDAAMRQRHAAAVARPSARTRAQLQQRQRAAMAGRSAGGMWRRGWPLATAFAAVLAVAVGLQLRPQPAPQPGVPATDLAGADDGGDAAFDTLLDENPDFYLWLASVDADALAVE